MTKFKDIVFEKDVAIHCPEEWMDENIREALGDIGYRWNKSSVNVKVHSNWSKYENNSCINLENNDIMRFDKFEYYKEEGFNILHYDDVAIKDETSLEYELIIKGRKAEIGSELWHKDNNGEYKKVTIYNIILHDGENVLIRVENDKKTKTYTYWLYDDMFTKGIDDILFWEKPILYQLPDTEGNLSEVKIRQKIYDNKLFKELNITCLSNGLIEARDNNGTISVFSVNVNNSMEAPTYTTNKVIIYQLPDTEGNLSEVKVGQEVYLTEIAINKTKKHKISKLYDGCIYFNDTVFVWNCTGYGYVNFGGVNRPYYKTTTNKPYKDFSDCPHWEDNPKAKYWGVNKNGESYFYELKPTVILDYGYFVGWASDKHAGFRQDLLNENGVVEDWEYSLVKRPEGK